MLEIQKFTLGSRLVRDLSAAVAGNIQLDVSLKEFSRWGIGGPASAYAIASSRAQVREVLTIMRGRPEPFLVVGQTSNLLFDSTGFDGIILRLGGELEDVFIDGTRVVVGAATSVPQLADEVADAGLTGIEHIAGIPGTLGGLVTMNGGTRRRGIGENVVSVDVIDADGRLRTVAAEDSGFSYRDSAFQRSSDIIVSAVLRLAHGDKESIQAEIHAIRAERKSKFPSDQPNCGSTFLSDPAMYATIGPPGKAIEEAGLKGLRRGGAIISTQHANFINNLGNATSDDVLWLIEFARSTVLERTGFNMPCEVNYVSRDGEVQPAHLSAGTRWSGRTKCEAS